jgi:hypothetical protein
MFFHALLKLWNMRMDNRLHAKNDISQALTTHFLFISFVGVNETGSCSSSTNTIRVVHAYVVNLESLQKPRKWLVKNRDEKSRCHAPLKGQCHEIFCF